MSAGEGFDAIVVIGFGGPEKPDDVIPFLENVLRGRNVPRERMLEVAEHYYHFGGVSPINQQVRELIEALRPELAAAGITLPVFWGNRNWHPLLEDTFQQMADKGVRRALGLVLAAYGSYSSCKQYKEDIERAQAAVQGAAPQIHKIRLFYNHPDFITANADCLQQALDALPAEVRDTAQIAFTAHSIPNSMAANCAYVEQLQETCRLITEKLGLPKDRWELVYQSRSGRPQDPWLEPDICDYVRTLKEQGASGVVIAPVGFLSDHMEVMFDLDEEAHDICQEIGLPMSRSRTVGVHPAFISMLRKLIQEQLDPRVEHEAVGQFGPREECPPGCCPPPRRPPMRPSQ